MKPEDIIEKQIQINWDYAKQQNDIRCRLFLQSFVICLTVGASFTIATIVEKINTIFLIPAAFFFILTIYFVIKVRSVTYDLEKDWEYAITDLNELIKLIIEIESQKD